MGEGGEAETCLDAQVRSRYQQGCAWGWGTNFSTTGAFSMRFCFQLC